ncbi:hypothetical protein BDA99DRAFT_330812 [Phascolomyces articulosus]|uniref:Secreted protein n=1 Tax=Phascolomyces articulosus TaxID=60185 RepID=A0AAD5JYX8_9FUNG|nr:hypothetical protein BDA99DRAFT_330812 [Phascolomyces articulosus]
MKNTLIIPLMLATVSLDTWRIVKCFLHLMVSSKPPPSTTSTTTKSASGFFVNCDMPCKIYCIEMFESNVKVIIKSLIKKICCSSSTCC